MKRLFILTLTVLVSIASLQAQPVRIARPYPDRGYGYDRGPRRNYGYGRGIQDFYFGIKAGRTSSHISTNSSELDGSSYMAGSYFGIDGGVQIAPMAPLYLESGIYYVGKGGKSSGKSGNEFTYDLNYLEVPVLMRYKLFMSPQCNLEPFFGMYMAEGVGGKIRNYGNYSSFPSFRDGYFRRFDSGVRLGCAMRFLVFQLEAAYDFGLVNIGQNVFDETRNGCFFLSFGFVF